MAEWLGDDLSSVDVVSISPEWATVTFHRYRDFEGEPFPVLEARLRVDLMKQSVQFMPELETGPLRFFIGKSELVDYEAGEQTHLDAALRKSDPVACSRHKANLSNLLTMIGQTGRSWETIELGEFFRGLPEGRYQPSLIEELVTEHAVYPSLDDYCGRYLKYRDLIECGETYQLADLDNRPVQPESFGALRDLAFQILDPVIEEYGMIGLTYGFCSPGLSRKIPSRIAPKVDQHSACELNRRKVPICSRRGAAVDFIVEHESMLEVAQWIVRCCNYDRLYFYGDDRPVHVSFGPENKRSIVMLKARMNGTYGPRNITEEKFLAVEDLDLAN